MIRWMLTAAALAATGLALAKLPPPDDAAKAKAAEAAARSAWQAKVAAYKLCKVQDAIAAKYKASHPATGSAATTGAPAAMPAASAPMAGAPAAMPAASAPMASASAATPIPRPTGAAASQGGGTPVAVVSPTPAPPPCADPGPFAYTPPEQKPLESSGAHSPAATAISPPSVRAESGSMTSGKTDAAPKK